MECHKNLKNTNKNMKRVTIRNHIEQNVYETRSFQMPGADKTNTLGQVQGQGWSFSFPSQESQSYVDSPDGSGRHRRQRRAGNGEQWQSRAGKAGRPGGMDEAGRAGGTRKRGQTRKEKHSVRHKNSNNTLRG